MVLGKVLPSASALFDLKYTKIRASQVAPVVKNPPANVGDIRDSGSILGLGRFPLEDSMATHSSILAWRILRTEEPDRLQPMGSQRVRHD